VFSSCVLVDVNAHELESSRLNLVQREPAHVSATFFISPQDYFGPVLEPQIKVQNILLYLASLEANAFSNLYLKAQSNYKQQIGFKSNKDQLAVLSHWQFAAWQVVQKNIQTYLAQQLVNPQVHSHLEPIQFSVQLTGSADLSVLQPILPVHWARVLVVASKPQQQWVDTTKSSPWIKF
jgi:hypothetical protein